MIVEEAIRILDPKTSADAIEEIRKANGSLSEYTIRNKVMRTIEEACVIACNIMKKHSAIVEQLEEEREYSYADFEQYAELHNIDSEDDWFYAGLRRAIEIVKVGDNNETD